MVTGAMTINDAFAQTNTERLITVVDTTADTNTMVSNLVNLWSNFDSNFTPILSVINDLSDELSTVSDKVSEVSSDVMAVDSKINNLESKFDQFVATDAENTREAQTNYDNLANMLPDIQSTVDTIVDDADTSFDTISDKLDALQAQIGTFTSSITTLQEDVSEIQSELGLVQESVSSRIGPAPTNLDSGEVTGKVLLSWYTQGLTKIPTGGEGVADGDSGYYTANFRFVCESDVFIQKITTNLGDSAIDDTTLSYTRVALNTDSPPLSVVTKNVERTNLGNPTYVTVADAAAATAARTSDPATLIDASLTADGRTLFDSYFNIGGSLQVYDRDIVYPNVLELKAGDTVEFKSSVYDPNTDAMYYTLNNNDVTTAFNWGPLEYIVNATKNSQIAVFLTDGTATEIANLSPFNTTTPNPIDTIPPQSGATKAQLASVEAYEVKVEYFSADADPECKITPSKTTALSATDQVAFVSINDNDGSTSLVQDYDATLDCDLNTVRITDVVGYLSGADGLNNFVTMELKVGKDTKAEFTFADNTSVLEDESSLPFEFSGSNLMITGDLVDNSSILVQITYDSALTDGCAQN
jgi:archaellum component FlaC